MSLLEQELKLLLENNKQLKLLRQSVKELTETLEAFLELSESNKQPISELLKELKNAER